MDDLEGDQEMKIEGGLVLFAVMFAVVIGASVAFGSYDSITPAVTRSEMKLTIGDSWTSGISAAGSWIFKLALGSVCAGFGVAVFNEVRRAYKLWKRSAQAGRWQAGPNANFQRSQTGTKFNKHDMLLLALSGRLPEASGKTPIYSTVNAHEEDQLDIEM
jgi:hypothetical protein